MAKSSLDDSTADAVVAVVIVSVAVLSVVEWLSGCLLKASTMFTTVNTVATNTTVNITPASMNQAGCVLPQVLYPVFLTLHAKCGC
jgi:hypothetical protein